MLALFGHVRAPYEVNTGCWDNVVIGLGYIPIDWVCQ